MKKIIKYLCFIIIILFVANIYIAVARADLSIFPCSEAEELSKTKRQEESLDSKKRDFSSEALCTPIKEWKERERKKSIKNRSDELLLSIIGGVIAYVIIISIISLIIIKRGKLSYLINLSNNKKNERKK